MASGDFYDVRFDYARTALPMGAAHPIAGVGPGASTFHYPLFWDGVGQGFNAYQLHSVPLQVWAELGLVGVAACALLLWAFWRSRSHVAHGDGSALFLPFIGYLPLALTDYHLNTAPVAATLGALVGLVAGASAASAAPKTVIKRRRRHIPTDQNTTAALQPFSLSAWAVALLTVFVGWTQHFPVARSRSFQMEAMTALSHDDLKTFERRISAAIDTSPSDLSLHHHWGMTLLERARQNSEPSQTAALLVEATRAFERSLTFWPHDPFALAYHGWTRLFQGDPAGAWPLLHRSAQLLPVIPRLGYTMAVCAESFQAEDAMVRCLTAELMAAPDFALATWWQESYRDKKAIVHDLLATMPDAQELAATTAWWWGMDDGPLPALEAAWRRSLTFEDDCQTVLNPSDPLEPSALMFHAQRLQSPESRRQWLAAAFLCAGYQLPNEAELNEMTTALNSQSDRNVNSTHFRELSLAQNTRNRTRIGARLAVYSHLVHNVVMDKPVIPIEMPTPLGLMAVLLPPCSTEQHVETLRGLLNFQIDVVR